MMDFGFINEGWFGILAGTVINVVVAEVWRRRGPHYPALSYIVSRVGVFHSPSPVDEQSALARRLQLRFDGEAVRRVEIFTVAIWNGQTLSIDNAALSKRDPLRLRLRDGGVILGVEILANSDEVGDFALDVAHEEIRINFDFIAAGQGVKLLVYTSSDRPDPAAPIRWESSSLSGPMLELAGTLKNMRVIRLPSPRDEFPLVFYRKPIIAAVVLSMGLAGTLGIASFFVADPLDAMLRNIALTTFFFWQFLAWIPLGLFAGYFKAGFQVPRKLL